jgi:hypothetical protein
MAVLHTFDEAELLQGTLEHHNFYASTFIGIHQAVPCILHLENGCGNKFSNMLFLEGYDKLATNKEKKELLLNIEKLANTKVLDSVCRPANWQLATAKDKDSRQVIKDQTISNSHLRNFLVPQDLQGHHQAGLPLDTNE